MRAKKGSQFERKICRTLSRWWSLGGWPEEEVRDDIFWRSSQSGGRATWRARKGLKTANSYGDVAAMDPIGRPLLKMFTIELKRGDSHGHPLDLLDARPTDTQRKWEKTLKQTVDSMTDAGSLGWLLIHQRDFRESVVYIDWPTAKRFNLLKICPTFVLFKVRVNEGKGKRWWRLYYGCLRLEDFLRVMKPAEIIEQIERITE